MLSNKGKSKLLGMTTEALTPYLIEVTNPDLGTFRYTNLDSSVEFEGHTFTPAFFELSPPEKTDGQVGNAKITISAVDQEWIVRIRTTRKKSSLRMISCVVYEDAGNVTVEPVDEIPFALTLVDWDEVSISWDMEFDDVMQINIPCAVADSINMAGCA